ncbi:MAG: ABC transporter permease [bacterium]|nr:ABC transporter permease [bacterium]
MQVFKTFFKVVKHYIWSVLIYFVVFFVLCFLLAGSRSTDESDVFSSKKADMAVIDRDQTSLSKDLTSYLSSLQNIKEMEDNTQTMQNDLYQRNVDYILFIPKGYEENIKKGEFQNLLQNTKVPDSFSGTYIDSQINQYLKTLRTYISAGSSIEDAVLQTKSVLDISTNVTLQGKQSSASSVNILYFYQYLVYVLICVILCSLGPILVRFNDRDLTSRMNASSLTLRKKNVSLILSSSLFSLICWLIFMTLAAIFYRDAFFSKIGLLCSINSFLFLVIVVAFTFLISSLISNADIFNMIANTVGLGMSFLCGIFVPASVMNANVLKVARVLPAYWYMDAHNRFTSYVTSSEGLSVIVRDFGIQALFAVSMFIIALVVTKVKRTTS